MDFYEITFERKIIRNDVIIRAGKRVMHIPAENEYNALAELGVEYGISSALDNMEVEINIINIKKS